MQDRPPPDPNHPLPGEAPRARAMRALALLATVAALAGCTSQAWYQGAQVGAQLRCEEGPPAAYDDCMARQNPRDYEAYRREREAATKAP